MVPGKEYEDILLIENGTDTRYTLYFKIKEIEDDELANELLDNIEMTVYLDNVEIYKGKVKGLNYENNGENLQNAIKIGDFNKNDQNTIKVITKLADSYDNINNDKIGKIEWQFYAYYGEEAKHGYEEIVPNPKTGDFTKKIVIKTLLCSLLLMVIFLTILIRKQERRKI